MKALILREFLDAQIVDIDHSIKQFSILSGAFVINKVYEYFPDQTIFICVIDPGVGSKREPIIIDTGRYKFVGPNNGLFHYLLSDPEISYESYVIKEEFRPVKSTTCGLMFCCMVCTKNPKSSCALLIFFIFSLEFIFCLFYEFQNVEHRHAEIVEVLEVAIEGVGVQAGLAGDLAQAQGGEAASGRRQFKGGVHQLAATAAGTLRRPSQACPVN